MGAKYTKEGNAVYRRESHLDVVEIDARPSQLSQLLAGALAILAPLGLEGYGFLLGLPGAILLAIGIFRGHRAAIYGGWIILLTGICVAAVEGIALTTVLLATVLSIVTWDLGRYGIDVGQELGRDAASTRIEIVHAVWGLSFGLGAMGVLVVGSGLMQGNSPIVVFAVVVGLLILVLGLLIQPRNDGSQKDLMEITS